VPWSISRSIRVSRGVSWYQFLMSETFEQIGVACADLSGER